VLKQLLRDWIGTHAPRTDAFLHARALRRHFRERFRARQSEARAKIYPGAQPVVLSGPFAGTAYLDEIVWGPIEPKWLGAYEAELHDVMALVLRKHYDAIVDIGSAEGYYSVGLARLLPATPVFSFDVDPWARAQQRRLARLNKVENIRIGRFCSPADIDRLATGHALVICDIEGHEYGLIDPVRSARLATCDILVELHPNEALALTVADGCDRLKRLFAPTHHITFLEMQPRRPQDYRHLPHLAGLAAGEIGEYLDECRDFNQGWLWMEAAK
jgi:hypothetical protein